MRVIWPRLGSNPTISLENYRLIFRRIGRFCALTDTYLEYSVTFQQTAVHACTCFWNGVHHTRIWSADLKSHPFPSNRNGYHSEKITNLRGGFCWIKPTAIIWRKMKPINFKKKLLHGFYSARLILTRTKQAVEQI